MGGGKEKRKKKKIIIIIMIELAQLWDGKGGKRAIKCEKEVIARKVLYIQHHHPSSSSFV
jgi:hypothetical protein